VQFIHHPNGTPRKPEDYELDKLQLGTLPRCEDCTGMIAADRLRWFAKNCPGVKPATCGNCAFARKVEKVKQRSQSGR
jgi:hypothetical protein